MARLTLKLFGGFGARDGNAAVRFPRRKTEALLAYLVCSGGGSHPRDKLAALLWPDVSDAQARQSLRQPLANLRRALPPGALRVDEASVTFDVGAIDADVLAFRRLAAEDTPAALVQAASLYEGDLLAGLDVKDAPPFEEWLQSEREALRDLALTSLARVLASQRDANDAAGALHTALRLLAIDPLQEVVHRTVMRLQTAQGRRDAALRQYQTCVDVLQRELGVEPEAETKKLYREIVLQRDAEPSPAPGSGTEPAPGHVERAPASRDASRPIIGREAELAMLERALAEPVSGGQRLVMVLGEAGIGKSRVLDEFRARALARGARVLLGRAYESTQIVPFGPWVDALRRGGVIDDPAVRELDPVWRQELVRLLPELVERGREPGEAPDDAGRLFEGVCQLLERLALAEPLVILLEDLHWADAMTTRLLASLTRRPRRRPMALVASARDEELRDAKTLERILAELAADRLLERLVLGPLSRAQTTELTQHLARHGSDPATIAGLGDRLWAASHGHPFTIVETMTALDQRSDLMPAGALPVPQRVAEVIAERLDRLTERARAVAAVAAIIGREFDFPLLRSAAGFDDAEVADALEELVRRRILRVADEHFGFVHDRIRDVVVAQLLPPRRRLLHGQVAAALETLAPEQRDPDWAALGAHCRDAGLWEKAARYLREAGRMASMRSAERDAAACFEEAVAALDRLPRSAAVLEQTVDAYLELRNSWTVVGEFLRVPACLAGAQAAAADLGDARRTAWISLYMGQFRWWAGFSPDARAFAEEATSIAGAVDDRSLRITSQVYASFAWYNAGDYRRARDSSMAALELLRGEPVHQRHGHQALPIPMAHTFLAWASAELGEFQEGIRHGREALRLAESAGHRYCAVMALLSLAELYLMKGDAHEAVPLAERAVAIEDERGMWVLSRWALGLAYAMTGRVDEGIALMEQQVAVMESLGWKVRKASGSICLGHCYLIDGRVDDAERLADQALALARERGERGEEAWGLVLQGEIALRRAPGAMEAAAERYRQALALATELGMRPAIAHCHDGLARSGAGDDHLGRATEMYREMQMSPLLSPLDARRPGA
jgi:DNA-binding SARP family transcriptional activator/tetratricopeptide (TPR) repeat protein